MSTGTNVATQVLALVLARHTAEEDWKDELASAHKTADMLGLDSSAVTKALGKLYGLRATGQFYIENI